MCFIFYFVCVCVRVNSFCDVCVCFKNKFFKRIFNIIICVMFWYLLLFLYYDIDEGVSYCIDFIVYEWNI